MALIKCVECGNDVSSYATACPHCGCPVQKSNSKNGNDRLYDVEIYAVPEKNYKYINGFIHKLWDIDFDRADAMMSRLPFIVAKGVTLSTAETIKDLVDKEGCVASIVDSKEQKEVFTIDQVKETGLYKKYQPLTCPRCGSTAVTTGSRGYSIVWGFAGSGKTVNRCGKCGYTWTP